MSDELVNQLQQAPPALEAPVVERLSLKFGRCKTSTIRRLYTEIKKQFYHQAATQPSAAAAAADTFAQQSSTQDKTKYTRMTGLALAFAADIRRL
eukprot:m.253386 g.253386  ORF g.253386 m.253386 type:complete len:95 (-) comp17537_c0_seq1:3883-4167(-)